MYVIEMFIPHNFGLCKKMHVLYMPNNYSYSYNVCQYLMAKVERVKFLCLIGYAYVHSMV